MDRCEVYCYDPSKVSRLRMELENRDVEGMAKVFKVLGDSNRAKAVFALCEEDELCVCDIANILDSSVATASHHLRTLKKTGLLKKRKEGKLVFYSLNDNYIKQLLCLVSTHQQEVITDGK